MRWRLRRVFSIEGLHIARRTILFVVLLSADEAVALRDVADRWWVIVLVTTQFGNELEIVRKNIRLLLLLRLLKFGS